MEDVLAYLDDAAIPQREKLATLRTHVEAIRALDDATFRDVVRAIKKRLASPKIADDVAALVREVSAGRTAKPAAPRAEPPPVPWVGTTDDPQLTALEAAIAADPEEQGPYTVLADYCATTGDELRAQLITIGHALAKNPTHRTMCAARDALFAEHAFAILGVTKHLVKDVDWYMGFIRACHVYPSPEQTMAEMLAVLLDKPPAPARFVQRLVVENTSTERCDVIAAALAKRPRPTLRTLTLGVQWCEIGDISVLWPAVMQLRSFELNGWGAVLGDVRAPALERFAFDFGPRDDGERDSIDVLAPVLAATGLPQLRTLVVDNCTDADALCEALVRSPIVAQLATIELRMGTLSDAGAAVLLAERERLAHVRAWSFAENYLSDAMAARLAAELPGEVDTEGQRIDIGERVSAMWE